MYSVEERQKKMSELIAKEKNANDTQYKITERGEEWIWT